MAVCTAANCATCSGIYSSTYPVYYHGVNVTDWQQTQQQKVNITQVNIMQSHLATN